MQGRAGPTRPLTCTSGSVATRARASLCSPTAARLAACSSTGTGTRRMTSWSRVQGGRGGKAQGVRFYMGTGTRRMKSWSRVQGGRGGKTQGFRVYMGDRKSTRLNSSHITRSRMPSSA